VRHLDFIIHNAEQDTPPRKEVKYEFNVRDNVYEIRRGRNLCFSSDDLHRTIFNLQWHIHEEALKDVTESIRIHAGCGEWNGRRFIVVGEKGVGKTTLMLCLLYRGFRIIGDELVLVRDGKAMPFPRRFHVKEESMNLIPEMSDIFDSLPCNMTSYAQKMYSFTPQDAGYRWKIDEGIVRAVFYIVPNHRRESRLEECSKFMMVHKVMPMSFLSETEDHLKISHLCRMIDSANCYVLHLGNLEGVASALREKMDVL